MKRFSVFVFICWGCVFAFDLWAQEERSFRVLGFGDGDFKGVKCELMNEDGEPVARELEFIPNRKSRRLDLGEGQGAIAFYREETNGRGAKIRREIGNVDWPQEAEQLLLVFIEREIREGDAGFEILVLDESKSVWGARCVRFLNLSGAILDAEMQEFAFPVDEGVSGILCFEGDYSVPMTLTLSVPWEGKRKIVYSARFVADQYSPKLLVIKPPLVEGSFKVRLETLW